MRNLKLLPIGNTAEKNSLNYWVKAKHPLIVVFNFLIIYSCRFIPSLALKRGMYRLTGMKVGKNVAIGLMAMFDVFFPELIELKDNCIIGYNATILAHEFLIKELRTGKTVIGKNSMIGANSTVLAGVEIGDNCTVSAMSFVNECIPAACFAQGNPLKVKRKA